ncbi:DNA alkylation repair protein [Anaerobacillus sp. MEB173]|uniref:DNA alkylation repair protein n=1 Tax=Anaerobacillus sp. MEB173 TaxID=3383345 RepID=UPI003F8D9E27
MSYQKQLEVIFEENRNEDLAIPMSKYMRELFPFLGIKTPQRRELLKRFFNESNIINEPFQSDFVRGLWAKEEREYQYAALDYMVKIHKRLEKQDLPLLGQLIITKSWWDTVDVLSPKLVATIAKQYPEVIGETIEGWAYGENLWLQRSAILFQLKYKDKTDETLLFRYILQNATSTEFFIQKAIGWALREYSKTNSASVKQFIETNTLPKLSIREGSKYLT